MAAKNVFGEPLKVCGTNPITGFYRNGCCETDDDDKGKHTVCAEVTKEFLEFSKEKGNDLTKPVPEYGFDGLVPGDRWCLCATRWKQAYDAGVAPPVDLEATDERTLDYVDLDTLVEYALRTQ